MKWLSKNKILSLALLGYMILGLYNFEMLGLALKTSKYYFIEMLQILPAVFILTSLLQVWVPTTTIMKYFGDGSGVKGYLISFLIGSLSAGPIYAAFPVCKTLLKKGASIRNVVIILSAWAVVKVPMLINEIKFMGVSYMVIRWILTVAAFLVMAILMEKILKMVELPQDQGLKIDYKRCIMCKACVRKYPDVFGVLKDKIVIHEEDNFNEQLMSICPVGAITT
ncbi:MAG: permease [Clostridia bacterium]|nr:permease [Clostridia bacterium]